MKNFELSPGREVSSEAKCKLIQSMRRGEGERKYEYEFVHVYCITCRVTGKFKNSKITGEFQNYWRIPDLVRERLLEFGETPTPWVRACNFFVNLHASDSYRLLCDTSLYPDNV